MDGYRVPMMGEKARTEDGIRGVVVLVLPSRSLVILEDRNGLQHEVPLESVSVVDGGERSVYL